jgi:bifunctional oligoribonuclease and PAP phosphatase NrnA
MTDPFEQMVDRLSDAHSLLCLTHRQPDGDGLGAMVALSASARRAGVEAHLFLPENVPWRYKFLFNGVFPDCADPSAFRSAAEGTDVVVVLDTCSYAQLEPVAEVIDHVRDKTVVIDHHATADAVGAVRWCDPTAAASGLMMLELLDALGWPTDDMARVALATAIVSDTGWLRFSNTDGRCLRAMARLVEEGVEPDVLYERIYQVDRPERLALLGRVLANLEFHAGGQLAVMCLREADFRQTGARRDETENLINEAMRVGSVEVAAILVENPEQVRVSLRSRRRVDVSAVAENFGGGGHARAAGLRGTRDLDELKQQLIRAILPRLGQAPGPEAS